MPNVYIFTSVFVSITYSRCSILSTLAGIERFVYDFSQWTAGFTNEDFSFILSAFLSSGEKWKSFYSKKLSKRLKGCWSNGRTWSRSIVYRLLNCKFDNSDIFYSFLIYRCVLLKRNYLSLFNIFQHYEYLLQDLASIVRHSYYFVYWFVYHSRSSLSTHIRNL